MVIKSQTFMPTMETSIQQTWSAPLPVGRTSWESTLLGAKRIPKSQPRIFKTWLTRGYSPKLWRHTKFEAVSVAASDLGCNTTTIRRAHWKLTRKSVAGAPGTPQWLWEPRACSLTSFHSEFAGCSVLGSVITWGASNLMVPYVKQLIHRDRSASLKYFSCSTIKT